MNTQRELQQILRIEVSQVGAFRALAKRTGDPLQRAVLTIVADNEGTHAGWVRALLAGEAGRSGAALGEAELREQLGYELGEADGFGEVAERATDPVVRTVLGRIASDEARNAKLLRELLRARSVGPAK